MNWNGKINELRLGIYGGTFNPPHIGHLILASEALHQMKLDRILWVLTPDPPHKPGVKLLPLSDRLELLQAAITSNPRFVISRVDITRPPPHYAADTMQLLTNEYPDANMVYLMGADSLRDLADWHDPQRFIQVCFKIGVMARPDTKYSLPDLESTYPGIKEKLVFIHAPLLGVSSSDIRNRIKKGLPFQYFLPREVYEIIHRKKFYIE